MRRPSKCRSRATKFNQTGKQSDALRITMTLNCLPIKPAVDGSSRNQCGPTTVARRSSANTNQQLLLHRHRAHSLAMLIIIGSLVRYSPYRGAPPFATVQKSIERSFRDRHTGPLEEDGLIGKACGLIGNSLDRLIGRADFLMILCSFACLRSFLNSGTVPGGLKWRI